MASVCFWLTDGVPDVTVGESHKTVSVQAKDLVKPTYYQGKDEK